MTDLTKPIEVRVESDDDGNAGFFIAKGEGLKYNSLWIHPDTTEGEENREAYRRLFEAAPKMYQMLKWLSEEMKMDPTEYPSLHGLWTFAECSIDPILALAEGAECKHPLPTFPPNGIERLLKED